MDIDWDKLAENIFPELPRTAEIHIEYMDGQTRVVQDLDIPNGASEKDISIRYMCIKAGVDSWYTDKKRDKTIRRIYSTYNGDYLYSRKISHDSTGKYLNY